MSGRAILGASGRLGRLLRPVWPAEHPALWISRSAGDGRVQCDMLRDPTGLAALLNGMDCVICLAGVTHASDQDQALNATLAEAAIRAAHQADVPRVLLTSSAAVYGAQSGLLEEEGPCHPISDYGRAKRDMERLGSSLGPQLGVKVCSVRIANIAGADAILGGWCAGFQLDRFDDGQTPRRSYIGPVTLAQVLCDLSRVDHLPDILNVAAPGLTAMGDLLDAAELAWHPRPAPSEAIPAIALSTARLETLVSLDVEQGTPRALVDQWRKATGQDLQ